VAGRPGEFEVTAHLAERRVADAVRALAAAAGLKPVVGAAATVALTKEVAAVDVEAAPLGDVLDALLAGHGLGWTIEGDRLTVTAGAAAADRGAAVRAFRRAVEAVPKHPSALAARVWLANFDFEAGRWTEAAAAYQEVLERAREEPEVPYAVYNLGLVELNAGAFQTARSRFVDLVDRAPRSRWADYGWWWVARTHFDAGDLAAAKRSFESALRGRAREVASAAALAVCVLELLDGTEDRARAALDGERGDMRPQHAALREALEAVLRYRQTPTPARRTALIAALGRSGDGAALGPGGAYFAGRVYRDLGVTERAVALFDDASARTRGPLAHRMAFEVAEWYDAREQADPARQRYLALAVTDPKGYGPKAELRLAQLALREQNLDDCLRRCRTLLTRAGADRTATLATMGRAYELRRNYRAAAECFAGRAPEE
jgi:tetratricopeptide (TPR) repeat protein